MHEKLEQIIDSINESISKLKEQNLSDEIYHNYYNEPGIPSNTLVVMLEEIISKIKKNPLDSLEDSDLNLLKNAQTIIDNFPSYISLLTNNNDSYRINSINNFLNSIIAVKFLIDSLYSWEKLQKTHSLPKTISNRLKTYETKLNDLDSTFDSIEEKVETINDAYHAAEALPATLSELRQANEEVKKMEDEITEIHNESNEKSTSINLLNTQLNQKAVDLDKHIDDMHTKAESYIDKCEEAFRVTTSKGLAGAFEDRAKKLTISIRWWLFYLILALLGFIAIGYYRLELLNNFMVNPSISGMKLFIQVIISILAIIAPLWLAWLSTKQISQLFRLAEDYSYKASISKAYEGYRKEAISINDEMASRLFSNALTRLEEAPFRFLIEDKSHSSPLMEIISHMHNKNNKQEDTTQPSIDNSEKIGSAEENDDD